MRWVAALMLAAIPAPAPAPPVVTHPGFLDAAQLIAACAAEGPDALAGRAVCLGYVTGAVDQLLARPQRRGGPMICPPAGTTPQDAVHAVQIRARWVQGGGGVSAADFVRTALERAFPCPIERGVTGGQGLRL